jgi:hypothetical protein
MPGSCTVSLRYVHASRTSLAGVVRAPSLHEQPAGCSKTSGTVRSERIQENTPGRKRTRKTRLTKTWYPVPKQSAALLAPVSQRRLQGCVAYAPLQEPCRQCHLTLLGEAARKAKCSKHKGFIRQFISWGLAHSQCESERLGAGQAAAPEAGQAVLEGRLLPACTKVTVCIPFPLAHQRGSAPDPLDASCRT